MARYWIADAKRNILGPVDERLLGDLAAQGKLYRIELVSKEGGAWAPPEEFVEIAALFVGPVDAERLAREREEAQRLALLLDAFRDQGVHELFGVPATAPFEEIRRGFVTMAKGFHPARLPPDSGSELRAAYLAIFEYLAARLHQEDHRRKTAAAKVGPEDFLGLDRRHEGRIEARIEVACANTGRFSGLTGNLSTGGLFLASDRPMPPGTRLDLTLDFEAEGRNVRGTGVVIWENGTVRPRKPKGFGVRFVVLRPGDRRFLEEWTTSALSASVEG